MGAVYAPQRDRRDPGRCGGGDRGDRRALGVVACAEVTVRPCSLSASVPRPAASTSTSAGGAASTSTSAGLPPPPAAGGPPAGAVKLGAASQLPVGQADTDPGDGQPDIVIRQPNGTLVAYSAVCPDAGCTVEYGEVYSSVPATGQRSAADRRRDQRNWNNGVAAPQRLPERGGEIYALRA